jgi:hypothetical protein
VKKSYHTIGKQGKVNEQELAGYLARSGQILLPMVDLIEQCRLACDELIDVTGRAAIEAVLQLSANHAAGGPAQQGKRRPGEVVFHGRQAGQVMLSDRKLEVERPRLRTRGRTGREVEIPAYAAMRNGEQMGARMLEILMRGVSTRNYTEVIPTMAETVGVSRSAVSRRVVEASEAEVEALLNRRFDELKLLVIYIDGLIFGDYTATRSPFRIRRVKSDDSPFNSIRSTSACGTPISSIMSFTEAGTKNCFSTIRYCLPGGR